MAGGGASYNPYSHPGPSYPGSSNYPAGPYGVDVGYRPNNPQPIPQPIPQPSYGNGYYPPPSDPYTGRGRGRDGPRGGLGGGRNIPVPPGADIPQAPPSTLQKFEGTWICDIHASQPLDDILNALGVAPIKIRFLDGYAPVTTIRLTQPDNLRMDNRLPGGLIVGSNVPLDGRSFTFQDQETGSWESTAAFDGSKLVQERRSPRGTMYDVRAVYDGNPRTGAPGRWMLFKWSFRPSSGGLLSAERWLRRTQ